MELNAKFVAAFLGMALCSALFVAQLLSLVAGTTSVTPVVIGFFTAVGACAVFSVAMTVGLVAKAVRH